LKFEGVIGMEEKNFDESFGNLEVEKTTVQVQAVVNSLDDAKELLVQVAALRKSMM